jgi:hypothetical protein
VVVWDVSLVHFPTRIFSLEVPLLINDRTGSLCTLQSSTGTQASAVIWRVSHHRQRPHTRPLMYQSQSLSGHKASWGWSAGCGVREVRCACVACASFPFFPFPVWWVAAKLEKRYEVYHELVFLVAYFPVVARRNHL